MDIVETEEPFIITTADMLEIVSGGGNGSEYVDIAGLMETAAKELREKDAEIEQLRDALKPFSKLFLYPDDLGFDFSEDIKSDQDWDDDANDMQTENCFVLRRDIRLSRTALKEKE